MITLDIAKLGSYSVTLTNNQRYLGVSYTSSFTFTVTVVDPCVNTVVTPVILADLTVVNGNTAVRTWSELTDSIQTKYNIPTLCGSRTYALVENNSADVSSWLVLSNPRYGSYNIKASPTLDS